MDQPVTRADSATSPGHTHVTFDDGIMLECGTTLHRHTVAFRTYGMLNAERSNAVLICHALTLDQYVAEPHPITGKAGLVGCGGRPRASCGYQPFLCHLPKRAGRLHGLDRAA